MKKSENKFKNGDLVLTGEEGYLLFEAFCQKNMKDDTIPSSCKECPISKNNKDGCYYGWLCLDRDTNSLTEEEIKVLEKNKSAIESAKGLNGGIKDVLFSIWAMYYPHIEVMDITLWYDFAVEQE